jgi:hypothetical protein
MSLAGTEKLNVGASYGQSLSTGSAEAVAATAIRSAVLRFKVRGFSAW